MGKLRLISAILLLVIASGVMAQAVSVALSWTASTTAGVSYNVYQESATGACVSGTAANGTTCKKLGNVSLLTYTDTTPVMGSHYWYVVRAVTGVGVESNNSNEVSLDLTTPGAPITLSCQVTLSGQTVSVVCK